jgi:cell shape-determining protein MreC
MRAAVAWLFPYFILFSILNMPQEVQEKIALRMQEWKLRGGLFLHAASKEREQNKEVPKEIKSPHASLNISYPWIEARIVSHKQFPWSHMAWIDIGSKTEETPFPIVSGCPVVCGKYIVGLIEKVGQETSCMRLLSDPLLRPAVRVQRMEHEGEKEKAANLLLLELERNPSLMGKESHRIALTKMLTSLSTSFAKGSSLLLAKGELQGSIDIKKPLLLRGIGFTYDIGDEEGPSRDIRTGQTERDTRKIALIQPNDILITSGLDGLYPKGLIAAYVKKVLPLEEGAFSYEITAEIACPSFLDLSIVAILPPVPSEVQEESADIHALLQQIEAEIGTLEP